MGLKKNLIDFAKKNGVGLALERLLPMEAVLNDIIELGDVSESRWASQLAHEVDEAVVDIEAMDPVLAKDTRSQFGTIPERPCEPRLTPKSGL